jgi:molybdopterin synthase catalytic subunit
MWRDEPATPCPCPKGATVGDLLTYYEDRIPRLKEFLPSLALSVNQQYAGTDACLSANDEIALLPPVSGGASRTAHAEIVREPIDKQAVLERLKQTGGRRCRHF